MATGPSWTTVGGTSAEYAKSGGVMTATTTAASNRGGRNALNAAVADVKLTGRYNINDLTGTGSIAYLRTYLRTDATDANGYEFRLDHQNGGNVRLSILRRVASVGTTIVAAATAYTGYTTSDWTLFRYELQGTGATVQIRAKAWKQGTSEPGTWFIDFADTDPARIVAAGTLTMTHQPNLGFSGSFATLVFSLDDILVTDIGGGGGGGGSGSFTADAALKRVNLRTFTADAEITFVSAPPVTKSFTSDAFFLPISTWLTPSNGAATSTTPTLTFTAANGATSYQIDLDTSSAFNTGNKRTYTTGMTISGGVGTFVVPTALSAGTWYRRVRAGV